MVEKDTDEITVPFGYPTSLIYLDESGSKASASGFFVVAGVKVRGHGKLTRAILGVRDRHNFRGEFKFSQITKGALPAYYALVDTLENADVHIAACVVDRSVHDPFRPGVPVWKVHADVISQLLVGCINRRELVSVLLDGISTPANVSLEDYVQLKVNRYFDTTTVITSACLDSRTSDGLQVADLCAGAIAFERRQSAGGGGGATSPKARVAARLKAAFGGVELCDGRSPRVNIATYRGAGRSKALAKPSLSVVNGPKAV